MNPKLLLISLFGLACTINGQETGNVKPVTNVPKPSSQLTLDDLPSPQEIAAGMVAPGDASGVSAQDIQAAMENEARMARVNFPPPTRATGMPRPTDMSRSSGTQANGPISVGNIQVVYNDELRTIMRDYNITPEEIKQMLEVYAKGGEATITKERSNPSTGLQEIVTLDFENFTSQRPDGSIASVSPRAGPIPVGTNTMLDSGASPPQDPLQDFLSTEDYLQEQIKELDAQFDALNVAYRQGLITRQTRNENALDNREKRKRFEADLRAIQMEISRMTGGEKMDPTGPQAQSLLTREVSPRNSMNTGDIDITQLERENQRLEEMLRRTRQGGRPGLSGLGFDQSRFGLPGGQLTPRGRGQLPGRQLPGRQLPGRQLPGQLPNNRNPQYLAALRRELQNIRQQEQLIFQQLRQLRNRNPQLLLPGGRFPFGRNAFQQQQLRRRISFVNGNRPQLTRNLDGTVTGQNVPRRQVV